MEYSRSTGGIRKLLCFFSLSYYVGVIKGERKFRFLLSILIISILLSIQPSYLFIKEIYPLTRNLEKNITRFINEYYPENLEIKIEKGKVSTNVSEPYYVTLPQSLIENPSSFIDGKYAKTSKTRILAIDTKGSAEEFEAYQSLALLTQNNLIYYKSGNINIQSLRDVNDLVINKNKVLSEMKKYNNKYNFQIIADSLMFILPFFLIIITFIFQITIYLLLSLMTLLMFKINSRNVRFSRIIIYTASVAFAPSLIWNLINLIPLVGKYSVYLSYMPNILILGIAYLGILRFIKESPEKVSENNNATNSVTAPLDMVNKQNDK